MTNDAAEEGLLNSISSSRTKLSSRFARLRSFSALVGTDFTVADQLFFDQVEQAAIENEEIVQAVNANSLDSFTEYLSGKLIDLFLVRLAGNEEVCNKVMSTDELRKKVAKRLAKHIYTRTKKKA